MTVLIPLLPLVGLGILTCIEFKKERGCLYCEAAPLHSVQITASVDEIAEA